jgi:hypothetical protein
MIDYTLIDNAILAAIADGKRRHQLICNVKDVIIEAEALCTPATKYYRVVDRRTQDLRKRGLISFNSKIGWSLTNV